jgi:hypothetical protein
VDAFAVRLFWFFCGASWLLLFSIRPRGRSSLLTRFAARVALVCYVTLPVISPTICVFDSPRIRMKTARLQFHDLRVALDLYYLRYGYYPDALESLADSGLIGKIPRDPWGRDWEYTMLGSHAVLRTRGADHRLGGEGEAGDIDDFILIEESRKS